MSSIAKTWKEKETQKGEDKSWIHHCQRCGKCCKKGEDVWQGTASIHDVAVWIAAKRFDILKWVDPIMTPSLELLGFDIWISPIAKDDVKRCPWLRKRKGEKFYECSIHDVKPQVCRHFPVDLAHGKEVGCPACQEEAPSGIRQTIKDSKARLDKH